MKWGGAEKKGQTGHVSAPGSGASRWEAGHAHGRTFSQTFRKCLTLSSFDRQSKGVHDNERVVLQLALQDAHDLDLTPRAR